MDSGTFRGYGRNARRQTAACRAAFCRTLIACSAQRIADRRLRRYHNANNQRGTPFCNANNAATTVVSPPT